MRKMIGLSLLALALAACDPQPATPADTPVTPPETSGDSTPMTTLTPEETAAGWKALFNGTDLTGWRGYKKDVPGAGWAVENGELTLASSGSGDLMTVDEYGPFELSLEWKISPNGNSGIIYLVNEDPSAENTYNTGPEMQVLDNDGHADGKIPSHRAGALYDFVVPPEGAVKPVGEWNQAVVRFTGSEIEHWLNGTLVSETSYGDEAWKAKVAATKFKQWPLFGTFAKGHIALQDHGDRVWYRNIKIREL